MGAQVQRVQTAGTLRDGVPTVTLEARKSLWRFAAHRAPLTVEAFSESGRPPLMPGPFLRVPAGTQLRITIHNALATPLTFLLPMALHGGPDRLAAMDSLVVAPRGSTVTRWFSLTPRPDSAAAIDRDTMLVQWRPLAKDGFDIPRSWRQEGPARQVVSVGETYDFEYTPLQRGDLRLEVRTIGAPSRLLIRVPIRVE